MMLQALREEVWRCNLELPKNDLVKMTSGNVSGRDAETGYIVIKPSGIAYEDLTPENMVIVDPDGALIEGDLIPSIDTPTHLYIYRHRADVAGVVHTHSPYVGSFAVLGQPIPPVVTTCGLIGGGIPLGAYAAPIGQDNIGKEVLRVIGKCLAVVLQSHGLFSIGNSATQATRVAVEAEDMAMIAHLAMLRGDPIILTDAQVEEMIWVYGTQYGQVEREKSLSDK